MALLVRRAIVAAKLEQTEGTDAMATPGTLDANTQLLVINPQVEPVADEIKRDITVQHLSPLGTVIGARYLRLTFGTELRGRGAVPTSAAPLRDNPLFFGCGLSPTYATSSAVYKFNSNLAASAGLATVTLYAFIDGVLHIGRGCRGNLSINGQSSKFGIMNWMFEGVFTKLSALSPAQSAGILDTVNPPASFDVMSTKPPPILGCQFQTHAFSAVVQAFTFDCANEIVLRESITADNGYAGIMIGNRDPVGTINPEAVLRASHDFWQRWQDGTTGAIDITVGSAVGNQMRIRVPSAQYKTPKWGNRNDIRTYEIPFGCNATADVGDDEFELHFL